MASIKWTPEQVAIHAAMAKDGPHLMVKAVAGSGKTATVVGGARALPEGSWFSAFNRSAANQVLAPRLAEVGSRCKARTLHSLGFALVREAAAAEGIRPQVVNDKDPNAKKRDILHKYLPEPQSRAERMAFGDAVRLMSLCQAWLVDGNEREAVEALCADHALDFGRWHDRVLDSMLGALMDAQQLGYVDFDDMVWLPAVMGMEPRVRSPLGIVDEAQDMSACQHALVRSLADRLIFIGDPAQALYRFRGADSESMERLSGELAKTDRGVATLPLTVNWRCGQAHIRLAQMMVPEIRAHDGAPEGTVGTASEDEALGKMGPGWAALCRTNAPLMGPALALLRRGQRAVIRGRDFGAGLEKMVAMLEPVDVADLLAKSWEYQYRESDRLRQTRYGAGRISALEDRCEALRALAEGCATLNEVQARLSALFSDREERGAVVFSTVHRAKGDEWPHVAVLSPDLMPHPRAGPADEQTERNIAYVAVTRPRESLTWLGGVPAYFEGPEEPATEYGADAAPLEPYRAEDA